MTKTFRRGDRVAVDGQYGAFRSAQYGNRAMVDFEDGSMASVDFDALQAAPVKVVGPVPAPPPSTCPECGTALSPENAVRYRPTGQPRKKLVRVVACGGCDFLQEVTK